MKCKYCQNEIPKKHTHEEIFNVTIWETIAGREHELEVDLHLTGFCQKCTKATDILEKHFITDEDLKLIINAKKEELENG